MRSWAKHNSRTNKSIINSVAALLMYFINLILEFYSRVIFLHYLGTEILGLNTTANNILQFLNLAEMGVWTAIATSLYKPLHTKDYDEINRIVTFNGHIYKRIGLTIIAIALVVMCFFPLIFKKMTLPLWYAYASFGVLLFSSLLGYFANYRQFLLSSDQLNYKVIFSYKLSMACKVVAQIIAMKLFPYPYIWWLGLEFSFAIIGSLALNRMVRKTYPFLEKAKETYKELKQKYPEILKKIKQLFIQKISGFVLFQTSPLIIYGLATLTLVTLYGNYMIIINGLISLIAAMFNGMLASIGNLIASSDRKHELKVFHQLFTIRFYIIAIMCYGLWIGGQGFVEWWLGKEYLLEPLTLGLLTAQFFVYVNRYVIYDFLSGHGYFGDVWASIIEVFINLGLSILLGVFWGLNGVITGVLISLTIISFGWKPFYLFKVKLKEGFFSFWKNFIFLLILSGVSWILSNIILNQIPLSQYGSIWELIAILVTGCAIFACIAACLLFLLCPPFKAVLKRFI